MRQFLKINILEMGKDRKLQLSTRQEQKHVIEKTSHKL